MYNNPLHHLMNPSSIATFGAGNNYMKMGTMQALSIIKDGYRGKFFPVHPRENTVMGHRAYTSIDDLPETPDLAFIVVPSDQVGPIMEKLGSRGTKCAIVITAGFGETGEDGRRSQDKLNEIASKYGIRFLGPNCMGIINSELSLNTTVMPYTFAPGSFGFASQSGTYVTQTIPYLGKRGIRFSKAISVGNSANIDIIDALEYLGQDDQTKAIGLYIESVKDIRRFVEVARKITPHKPVIAQYVGGSSAGARSSLSHTGSMAAPDHLYEGMFKQAGIIRVHTVEELYGYGNMLAVQPHIKGKRIGVLTNSGGPGSAIANTLEKQGFEVPEFSKSLQDKIRPVMPGHAPCGNPVDLTFHMDIETLTYKIPSMILESGEVDGIVIHGAMRKGYLVGVYDHIKGFLNDAPVEDLLKNFPNVSDKNVSLIPRYAKPIAISSFYDRGDDYTAAYEDNNMPVFDSPEKAAGAMAMLLRHSEIRNRKPWNSPVIPEQNRDAQSFIDQSRTCGNGNLDEYSSKLFLKSWGIPVVEEIIINNEDEIDHAIKKIGCPLVLKANAVDILHKTGKGLIYLNIKSRYDAVASYRKIQESAGSKVSVIASRMVRGEREFVAGIVHYQGFGPVVMFGLGGIFTEAIGDIVFRPAPVSKEDAIEMIAGIRSTKLLGSFRGMPEVNIGSLANAIHRMSLIPLTHPEVKEIDVNPIVIEGSEPVAVDALLVHNIRSL